MRVLLIFGAVVLFTLTFAHHKEGHDEHDHDDHHDDHHDDDKKGEHKESLASQKIAPNNIRFAFDLYRQVARDHPTGNLALSPASISTAFALLALGAKAQTRSQIIEGLRFNTSDITEKEIHEGFHQHLDLLNDENRDVQVDGGNAIFICKEHKILQTFLDDAKRLYHSEAVSTDFTKTEEAKNQINSYVEKNTHGKIPKLLDSVDQDSIFTLINYIYIRGNWEHPFDPKMTREGDFHVDKETSVKVPFMSRTGMYRVAFSEDIVVVNIPYNGSAQALFIMPKQGKLSELEQNLTRDRSMEWRKKMHRQFVEVSIPKFSVSGTINLKETLSKMGMVDVFSDKADLSGITEDAKAKISKAVHKAVITVDEKGTEAAGSTALEAIPMMLPARVVLEHPFLFTLHDIKTRSLLFAARIVNPH